MLNKALSCLFVFCLMALAVDAALPKLSTNIVDVSKYVTGAKVKGVQMITSPDSLAQTATSVIIAIHGLPRTAQGMYDTTKAAAPKNAYIISIRFCNSGDSGVTSDTMVWDGSKWITGGTSTNGGVSSYDIIDGVAKMARDKSVFPNANKVFLIGHSAGAQTSIRYAALIKDAKSIDQYLIYNPGTTLYLTADRYKDPSTSACANTYNKWKYGLVGYNGAYNPAALATTQAQRKVAMSYGNKKINWFFGSADTQTATDNNCEAQLGGGSTRYGRGLTFWIYLNAYFATGADMSKYKSAASTLGLNVDFSKIRPVGCSKTYKLTHTMNIVNGVGHDEYKMVNDPASKAILAA